MSYERGLIQTLNPTTGAEQELWAAGADEYFAGSLTVTNQSVSPVTFRLAQLFNSGSADPSEWKFYNYILPGNTSGNTPVIEILGLTAREGQAFNVLSGSPNDISFNLSGEIATVVGAVNKTFGLISTLNPSTTTETQLYSCGLNNEIRSLISVCNITGSAVNFSLAHTMGTGVSADPSEWLFENVELPAYSRVEKSVLMKYNQSIRAISYDPNDIAFNMDGMVYQL